MKTTNNFKTTKTSFLAGKFFEAFQMIIIFVSVPVISYLQVSYPLAKDSNKVLQQSIVKQTKSSSINKEDVEITKKLYFK